MWQRICLGLLIMMLAAACGSADSTSVTPTDVILGEATEAVGTDPNASATVVDAQNNADSTSDDEDDSTIEVTGAATASFNGTGTFLCTDGVTDIPGAVTITLNGADFSTVSFVLPVAAPAGTYQIIVMGTMPTGNEANATVTLQGSQVYNGTSGTLTLDQVATGPDQPVSGSFEFAAESMMDAAQTVNVTGTFNFTSLAAATPGDLEQFYCEA